MRVTFRHPIGLNLLALAAGVLVVVLPASTAPWRAPGAAASGSPVTALAATGVRATTGVQATTVKLVSPVNARGHLRARYTVRATGRGHCWTASFMNGRLYRCFKADYILDPCWKENGRNSVVCLGLPWSTSVTRLRLTRRLPAKDSHGPGIWGLRLGGGVGVNCLVSTGAGGTVGKHPISYFCRRGWVLLGNGPNRSRSRWTMLTATSVGNHYELRGRKPLTTAWKAVP
jgi:hypothetical protein